VGTLATVRKEEIQKKIDEQQAWGVEGLLEEDCFLVECNLGVTDAPVDERIGRWNVLKRDMKKLSVFL
jgi:hypothetical protein